MNRYEDSFPSTAGDGADREPGRPGDSSADRTGIGYGDRDERRAGRRRARHEAHGRYHDDPQADLRERAVARLDARRGLTFHVLIYVLVNGMLVFFWVRNGGGFFWPVFPIAFWGIGLVWQVVHLFGGGASEEKIQAEMRRLGGSDR